MKKLSMKAVPVALPKSTTLPIPAVTSATSREAFCQGVIAKVVSSALAGVEGEVTGEGSVRGTGGKTSPSCIMRDPRTTSSLRSMKNLPSPPIERRNLVILLE